MPPPGFGTSPMTVLSGQTENAGHFAHPTASAMGQSVMTAPLAVKGRAYADVTRLTGPSMGRPESAGAARGNRGSACRLAACGHEESCRVGFGQATCARGRCPPWSRAFSCWVHRIQDGKRTARERHESAFVCAAKVDRDDQTREQIACRDAAIGWRPQPSSKTPTADVRLSDCSFNERDAALACSTRAAFRWVMSSIWAITW